jgi:hypothetical protein
MKTGQQWADSLIAGATAAKWTAGVQATTKDPAQLAIQQGEAYIQGVNEAYQSGRWAAGLQQSGPTWKQVTASKGQNYTTGLNAAKSRLAAVGAAVMANAQQISQQVQSMPKGIKGGPEGLARFDAARQGMIAFKKQGRLR